MAIQRREKRERKRGQQDTPDGEPEPPFCPLRFPTAAFFSATFPVLDQTRDNIFICVFVRRLSGRPREKSERNREKKGPLGTAVLMSSTHESQQWGLIAVKQCHKKYKRDTQG